MRLAGENMHLNVSLDTAEGVEGILLCDPLKIDAIDGEDLVSTP